jgi:hypothetical protein
MRAQSGRDTTNMRQALIRALAAAAGWVATSGAWASVSTGISVTDFRVQVTAIESGAAPAISFSSVVGSSSETDSSSGSPPVDQHRYSAGGRAFGAVATQASEDPFAGGAAALAGDAFAAGARIQTSAHASSGVEQSFAQATIGLADDVSTAAFTLAPWSVLTISANVVATASSTGAGAFEIADSGLLMAIGDAEGTGPQRAYINFNAFAFGGAGPMDDVETTVVRLTYVNDSSIAISGLFSGYVASYASSGQSVSTVDEPAGAGMLAAGLILLGTLSTRWPPVRARPVS